MNDVEQIPQWQKFLSISYQGYKTPLHLITDDDKPDCLVAVVFAALPLILSDIFPFLLNKYLEEDTLRCVNIILYVYMYIYISCKYLSSNFHALVLVIIITLGS